MMKYFKLHEANQSAL